jgi:LysM repeat protein
MRLRALVPVAAIMLTAPSTASAAFSHVVAPGESLSSVAASDGLSVEQLAAANGLSPEAFLIAGTSLQIPSQEAGTEGAGAEASEAPGEASELSEAEDGAGSAGAESSQETPAAPAAGAGYVVQPGDTLTQIAARAGTSVEGLAELNGIDPSAPLLSGRVLRLPGGSAEPAAGAGEGQAATPGAVGEEPIPTEETVSPSEVGSIAAEHGVPPSLAEAIAEQESGFNNGLTSSANARGVMQIIPETWSFISQNLAGAPPLDPASAASNVRGGVLLLRYLLGESEGDPARAAAGYFQGLESVRAEGELPETEEYVNSVLALRSRFAGEQASRAASTPAAPGIP